MSDPHHTDTTDDQQPSISGEAPPPQEAISLSSELDVIRGAVQAVGLITDFRRFDEISSQADEDVAAAAAAAVLALLDARLQLIVDTVTGQTEPRYLMARHNRIANAAQTGVLGDDIVLQLERPEIVTALRVPRTRKARQAATP